MIRLSTHGLLFALLQFGELLLLQLHFSAGLTTWLAVSVAWLLGTWLGLVCLPPSGERLQLGLQLLGLHGLAASLGQVPGIWLCGWVLLTGAGVGMFFRRCERLGRQVLLHENNGFVAGIPLTLSLYALAGSRGLLVSATLLAALLWLTSTVTAAVGREPGDEHRPGRG